MIDNGRLYVCKDCGGTMVGDGYTTPMHCEYIDCPEDREADAGPLYCGCREEEPEAENEE